MDIQLKKKPWYIRYRYYILAAIVFIALLIYVIVITVGPRRLKITADESSIQLAEVSLEKFLEYIDTEGLVQPILTLQVNTREGGLVEKIIREEGAHLSKGDTILILTNDELTRTINEERDAWEKERYNYQEREITMQQQRLNLQQQSLETAYEMKRLKKNIALEKEEYKMGIKSKAQLEVAEDEYNFKLRKMELQLKSLQHDSAVSVIRKELLQKDLERGYKKLERTLQRLDHLVVTAPISGQLSFVNATPGQQIGANQSIAQIKVLDNYKLHTQLSEYYVDRITTGLPATITYQEQRFPLKITKVVPEVKDRQFDVDLVFTADLPDNIRVGKSYRIQIELGQPEETVVIPRGNFYQQTGGQWIYKVNAEGTKATKVNITIGRQNPKQYEITEGLKPGDVVITTGYEKFGDVEELVLIRD